MENSPDARGAMTSGTEKNTIQDALPHVTGGRRIGWAAVPGEVAAGIERLLGGRVTGAVSQPGGFSEGLAARVRLADGGRAFVKAASSRTAPAVAGFHRREIAISRTLPRTVPAPRLLDAYDDGDWVALVFEDIPGRLPAQPWQPGELEHVLAAVTDLTQALTPSPVDERLLARPRLGGWTTLANTGAGRERLATLSPWAARHLDDLAVLEERGAPALTGRTLLHGDLYPFNIMLRGRRVFVVDWPHAWVGAAHCDLVTLLSGVSLSGLDPQPIAERHPLTRSLAAAQIDAVLAAHSGFLLRTATSAGPRTDHRLVDMMTALGLASLRWLRTRRGRSLLG
ncbi:aminoglycoside phosphotransferase family protein [Nonomuraea fuscirosea]|uniref:aminoglycoside phosphotransferase family protein n=1 Tax=Nonomuraea fuscirosea TaxID=1291556 RepID=UPI0034415FA1